MIEKEIYEFGLFFLDADERVLRRDEITVGLTPKAFDILLFLVRNHGSALTKDELLEEVWPNTFVEEVNVAVNISILRKVLSDSKGGRKYIATIPRRGYRFVADVKKACEVPAVPVHFFPQYPDQTSRLLRNPQMQRFNRTTRS